MRHKIPVTDVSWEESSFSVTVSNQGVEYVLWEDVERVFGVK